MLPWNAAAGHGTVGTAAAGSVVGAGGLQLIQTWGLQAGIRGGKGRPVHTGPVQHSCILGGHAGGRQLHRLRSAGMPS